MHKVVVKRPRQGRSWAKYRAQPQPAFEDRPRNESMKARHRLRKSFSDLLGPLRRWLQSQVGRRWNDVYSEACAVIKPDNVVRAHIKTHLLEFVLRHTFIHEGKVCALDYWRGGDPIPVTKLASRWHRFFVQPDTGILQAIPNPPRIRKPPPLPELRWIRKGVALKNIGGLWFEFHFQVVPVSVRFKAYDHALERVVWRGELAKHTTQYCLCTLKRQMSRRELRRFGLRNSVPLETSRAPLLD